MFFIKKSNALSSGSVVGTIHSAGALAAAGKLPPNSVDFLELRVDAFASSPQMLQTVEKAAAKLKNPLLVTVRHPKEGGASGLTLSQRRQLFRRFLPLASLIDVELRSAEGLSDILTEARRQGTVVILSYHDFRSIPPLQKLQGLAATASEIGCDVFKVAAMARTEKAVATLLDFLTGRPRRGPLYAVMGMGDFGKISRLTLGKCGSVLNYGYLDKVQVPGQWPAEVLKARLAELQAQ